MPPYGGFLCLQSGRNDAELHTTGCWGPILHFLREQAGYTGCFDGVIYCLAFLIVGRVAWRRSFTAGFICGFVAIAVVSFFEQLGVSEMDWSFVIGAAVGGAGVDRCRSLINAAVTLFANKRGISDDKQL